jgi:hypothetical protein
MLDTSNRLGFALHGVVLVVMGSDLHRAYHGGVEVSKPLEDKRGVDVARIRELLALTPAQRVAHMVEVVNALVTVRDRARVARQ